MEKQEGWGSSMILGGGWGGRTVDASVGSSLR